MSSSNCPGVKSIAVLVAVALQTVILVATGQQLAADREARTGTMPHVLLARPAPDAGASVGSRDTNRFETVSVTAGDSQFARIALEGGQIVFEGLGAPATIVDVVVNGRVVGNSPVDRAGTWAVASERLAPGDYRIETRSTDASGTRQQIGQIVGVYIPARFGDGVLLAETVLDDGARARPLDTSVAQRRRAEILAAAAAQSYSEIAVARGWTPAAQARDGEERRGFVRLAQNQAPSSGGDARRSDAGPDETGDGLLAPFNAWIDRATRSYREGVVRPLGREDGATRAPEPAQRREADPVRTVAPSREPAPAGGSWGAGTVLDDVTAWMHRARGSYDAVVRGLANPSDGLDAGDAAQRSAPVAAQRVRPLTDEARRKEIAVARQADEERRAAEARDRRQAEPSRSTAPQASPPQGQPPTPDRGEDERRAAEARQAELLRQQAEASRQADEKHIADMQRAAEERRARDARQRAEAEQRARDLIERQAAEREAEAARRAEDERRRTAAAQAVRQRATEEDARRQALAEDARRRVEEKANRQSAAADSADAKRKTAEDERQRIAALQAEREREAEARRAQERAAQERQAQERLARERQARELAERRQREAELRRQREAARQAAERLARAAETAQPPAGTSPRVPESDIMAAVRRQAREIFAREFKAPERRPSISQTAQPATSTGGEVSRPSAPGETPLARARREAQALLRSERERVAMWRARRSAGAQPVVEEGSATRGPVDDGPQRIASRPSSVGRSNLGAGGSARVSIRPACRRAGRKAALPGWYVVQPGDTLWQIAELHYGDGVRWETIYDANSRRLDDADMITPCQRLRIPRR